MSAAAVANSLSARSMLERQIDADDDNDNDDINVVPLKQPPYYEFKCIKANHEDLGSRKKEFTSVLSVVIPQLKIDDWYELFLSDDAPNSIEMYQTKFIGDTNFNVDEWRNADKINVESESLQRNLTYLHKISGASTKMPGMPTTAETFQHQTWKRYGDYGALMKTTTKVGKSVPMGDCFHVENEWLIEQNIINNVPCITLSVKVRLVFTKRTMFQSIITKNVLAETKRWFDGYKVMMMKEIPSSATTATQ